MDTLQGNILEVLREKEIYFRLESDEDGFYLSIIDRKVYPRIWADKFQDGKIEIIAESVDNIINKTILAEKDWSERFTGETINDCIQQVIEWYNTQTK